jgi:hypothetical protein
MPNDDMWKWIANPLVGVTAQPVTPTSLKMRKKPDLTVRRDPSAPANGPSEEDDLYVPTSGGDAKKRDTEDVGASRARDPDKEERQKRDKQQQEAKKPNEDRMADAAKDLVKKYAEDNLGPLKEKALNDLAKAWKESPGGVIALGAVVGAAGVTYLVKTGGSVPSIPAIPLDFLAKKAPIFKGAELNIEVKGPITGPESFKVSITFREQAGEKDKPKSPGRGKVLSLKIKLEPGGAKASSPETGADLEVEGKVAIPSKAGQEDVAATIKAIEDANVEVDVAGTPTYQVRVLSVTDNYRPGPYGLNQPPQNRALTVRLKTSIPPMFHQGKDEIAERAVWVRINRVSSEGEAKIKVHLKPFPPKEESKQK